jgi:imidazolonepropionase-like amidohydrolase
VRSRGHDYLKAPVDERMETRAGQLSWRSTSERGTAPAGSGFFLPTGGPFDSSAVLARALLRSPGRRVKVLPAGQAWIEDDSWIDLEVDGKKRRLRRVAIAGLGFGPDLVWLDRDGEYFAQVSTWQSVIAIEGEGLLQRLIAEDQKWRQARAARLAAQLSERPAGGLAITHARLFDSEKRRMRDDMTVVVAGDRITAVGGPSTKIPNGAKVVDARGRTLLPGLWDMHVHVDDDEGILHLASGVTTVRDLANDMEELSARVARFDAGSEIGPRVLRAGIIDGPGPLAAPTGVLPASESEARAAVERYAAAGYKQIKIYSSVALDLVPVIAREAHRRGLRVSGHVPNGMNAEQAVAAGFDEIQHANFLFLNFLAGPKDDTRTPLRFTLVAERAAGFDLDSAPVRKFLDLLVARKTVLDPTLAVFEGMFNSDPGELDPMLAPYAGRLPAQVERGGRVGGLPAKGDERARFRASHAAMGKLVQMAWKRGVRIVAGTDNVAGLTLQRELELYVAAGIPAADVLALATIGSAQVMGMERKTGSIAVGKQADMVLVDGDPVRDMADIRKTELVVCRGLVYDPDALLSAVGMRPREAR